jgi:tetratricopeptide (TPR) repeat protein
VQTARFEPGPAYESHRRAISILRSSGQVDELSAEHRYELARTLYLLANKHTIELGDRRGGDSGEAAAAPGPRLYSSRECRKSAVGILETLIEEDPNIPDYRFLLALCHRPSGMGPDPARSVASRQGWERAIGILEELKTQYPEVTDYRYELTATYAWVYVGLFPWQRPSAAPSDAEASLLEALEESEWLVAHNPSVPHYARSKALILAKLGTVCWRTGRVAEAEACFERALEAQRVVIGEFPDLPSHDRVVLEFVRLRLAEVRYDREVAGQDVSAVNPARDLLDACIENLTQLIALPELTEDRLAWTSLEAAYDVLGRVLDEAGEGERAEEAKERAEGMRVRIPSGRGNPWQL